MCLFEYSCFIEKLTLASREGKGTTGEVKHSCNKFCLFAEKINLGS